MVDKDHITNDVCGCYESILLTPNDHIITICVVYKESILLTHVEENTEGITYIILVLFFYLTIYALRREVDYSVFRNMPVFLIQINS